MNQHAIAARMEWIPEAVRALCAGLRPEDARMRGPEGQWCVLEIVCHLCDEEELDFGARLRLTLTDPATPWPPIDPEAWPEKHRYMERELAERVETFSRLRGQSIAWLRSLPPNVDWSAAHPLGGEPISRADLLLSWSAHDALHVRQIAKRMYELAQRDGRHEGFSPRYAGAWGA